MIKWTLNDVLLHIRRWHVTTASYSLSRSLELWDGDWGQTRWQLGRLGCSIAQPCLLRECWTTKIFILISPLWMERQAALWEYEYGHHMSY